MANNESIIALQNFINSSAFGLMPKSTQDEIRNNLATMLQEEQTKALEKVKECIVESVSQTLADSDIEFSFVIERKNKIVTIKECQPEILDESVPEEDFQEEITEESLTEETEEHEEKPKDEIQRSRKKSGAFSVTMPDGKVIQEKNAARTFIKVLQHIGLERIANEASSIKLSSWPVVSVERRPDGKESWQEQVDGWFVYTHASNYDKIKKLLEIDRLFKLNLVIKNVDSGETYTSDNEPIRPRGNRTNSESKRASFTANHDKTKFSLNGADFTNKRRFAWQVVKTYIEKNPTVTYSELQDVFLPEFTSKRLGVVRSIIDMPTDMPESEYPQRYLMKDDELIELADGEIITVCSQWNPERLANMIELAEKQGWSVRKAIDGVLIEEQPNTSYQTPEKEKPQSVAETNAEGSTFGVTFADGSYIEGDSSYETFLLTLKKIGLVRIPDVGITYGNINLVSVMEKDADKQIKIDGVYVYKNLNDEQMMNALQQISDYYYMDLEIGTEEE